MHVSGPSRLHAVRAYLVEMAGALAQVRAAARLTTSVPERHYLRARAARIAEQGGPAD